MSEISDLIPDYVRNLQVYQAGKPIDELVRERGITRVSKLASNENPLGPSPYAIQKMTNALWEVHLYPDMNAYLLKTSLSKLYKLKKENIILGNGSEGIMAYIARAFVQPGHEILTSEHSFIGFSIIARAVGAKLKTVPLTALLKLTIVVGAVLHTLWLVGITEATGIGLIVEIRCRVLMQPLAFSVST